MSIDAPVVAPEEAAPGVDPAEEPPTDPPAGSADEPVIDIVDAPTEAGVD